MGRNSDTGVRPESRYDETRIQDDDQEIDGCEQPRQTDFKDQGESTEIKVGVALQRPEPKLVHGEPLMRLD
jgi:hypothetical protein